MKTHPRTIANGLSDDFQWRITHHTDNDNTFYRLEVGDYVANVWGEDYAQEWQALDRVARIAKNPNDFSPSEGLIGVVDAADVETRWL